MIIGIAEPQPFSSLPRPVQVQLACLGPLLFGAICGFLLGVSEGGYLVFSILAVLGGVAAGTEHHGWRAGAMRGVIGGLLFGVGLVVAHLVSGDPPLAKIPSFEPLMVVFTTVIGAALGALGGALASRRERSGS